MPNPGNATISDKHCTKNITKWASNFFLIIWLSHQVEEEEEGDVAEIDDDLFDDVHDYDYLMMADQPSVDSKRKQTYSAGLISCLNLAPTWLDAEITQPYRLDFDLLGI